MRWIIGIDEVGRGPLAGPIAVGAVALPPHLQDWKHWEGLKDSKRLSEKKRWAWRGRLLDEGACVRHAVHMVDARTIDERGIQYAARIAASEALRALGIHPHEGEVFLDYGLAVPQEWKQEQFVKGDERFPAIALASIMAKVARDEYMTSLDAQFPHYTFGTHKGYGTLEHRKAIQKHGLVREIHRWTFCKRLTGD